MKEFISNIEPEVYDREIYPQIVMGVKALQKTVDGDMLIMDNPESRHFPVQEQEEQLPIHKTPHPLQGEFVLLRPIRIVK